MYLRRLARKLRLNPDLLHPHNLRHLRATELYKSRKFTELELMKWFGWRTKTIIDVYSRIVMDNVEERVRELYGIGKPPQRDLKFCQKCGLRIDFEAKYCPRCGTKLDVEQRIVYQNPRNSGSYLNYSGESLRRIQKY